MSGPKVVRIVTREEILAICHGQLARLDALTADWARRCKRADCLDQGVIDATKRRRQDLAALMATDDLLAFQKQVAQEMDFLSADLEKRLAAAAATKAAAASHARRQSEAAKALIKALKSRDQSADADLIKRLSAVSKGSSDPEAIARGFAALSVNATDGGAEKRRGIAAQYKGEGAGPSLSSWRESQERSPEENRLAAVERRLAELQVADEESTAPYVKRFAELLGQEDKRRSLLLDSLELDLAKILTRVKARARLAREIELSLAELRELSPTNVPIQSSTNLDVERLEKILEDITTQLQAARDAAGLASRRKALLDGLAALGYETNEGMETAWANDGRVVLRSSARPEYGVEVAGNTAGGRVQMRTVAFASAGANSESRRDVEAETAWCGEVAELTAQLARAGVNLSIEKAYPVGAVPLKRVSPDPDAERNRAREGSALRKRELR